MSDSDTLDPEERRLAAALKREPEAWTLDCLTPERIISLAERSLSEAEAVPLLAHIALCARCRHEYAETVELVQLADEVHVLETQREPMAALTVRTLDSPAAEMPVRAAPSTAPEIPFWKRWLAPKGRPVANEFPRRAGFGQNWFSPGLGFALGAAAASAALFFAVTTPEQAQRDRLASTLKQRDAALASATQEKQALGQELAALKDRRQEDATRLAQEASRLHSLVQSQSVQVARLEAAETTLRQMPLPTAEWMLSRSDGQVRGAGGNDAPAPEIRLVSPVLTATAQTQPVLECRPIPGASAYEAHLEIEGSNEEAPALRSLSATRWQPSGPLKPGTIYRWAVTAQQRAGAMLRSPLVKFYVLSEAQGREVESARRQYANHPLTLGAVYARLGMLPEAETQFRAALKADPTATVARRWLDELEARCAAH